MQAVVYLPMQVMGGGTHKCFGIPQTTVGMIKKKVLNIWNCCRLAKGRIYVQCFSSHRKENVVVVGGVHKQHSFTFSLFSCFTVDYNVVMRLNSIGTSVAQ